MAPDLSRYRTRSRPERTATVEFLDVGRRDAIPIRSPEGKTALVVSLATLAARSNKKVLIIDLDLRHPSVHRELGWQVSAGIVEYMSNERSLEEVIHHDLETGLHFLPVKTQTTNLRTKLPN